MGLKVGKVGYLNTVPLFYSLEGFDVVEGHPSELVKELRAGKIDAGIVSSAELFFNPESYYILSDLSISSKGKVCSVLLLSNEPMEEIERIRVTPNSLTSRFLLLYILKCIYGRKVEEVAEGEDAFLAIGDEAIQLRDKYPYTYDLGEEWFKATGLPFVFALFLVRREVPKGEVRRLKEEVEKSVERFYRDMREGRTPYSKGFYRRYFTECIDYSLGEEHLRALGKFFSFLEEETGKPAPKLISPSLL